MQNEISGMKLCKDCKHLAPDLTQGNFDNAHIRSGFCGYSDYHLVTGQPLVRAWKMRGIFVLFGGCGKSAKYFEAKEV